MRKHFLFLCFGFLLFSLLTPLSSVRAQGTAPDQVQITSSRPARKFRTSRFSPRRAFTFPLQNE